MLLQVAVRDPEHDQLVLKLDTLGDENENLQRHIDDLKTKLDAKTSDVNERVREIGRLTNKLLDQDEEIAFLNNSVTDKDYDIQLQRVKMKDFESTLIEKNITITKLEKEIESIKHFKFTNEQLKRQMQGRDEEVGVLKAKLYLDQISINLKIVAEYPDLLEENYTLDSEVQKKEESITQLQKDLA